MASDELRSRLANLPGVVSCTVDEETVALLLDHDADPRLLKARAQAVCAEMGEFRPLIVAGGPDFGAARAGAGLATGAGAAGWRSNVPAFFARRATPVTIAVLSLIVLSAVVVVPDGGVRPGPQFRNSSSPSVAAVGPLSKGEAPVARPGAPALTNIAPLGPLVPPVPSETPVTAGPGPVLVGLTMTDFDLVPTAFGPADVAPPVASRPVDIGPPVAAPAASAPSAAPTAGAVPSSAPAPTAAPAPSAPTAPAPTAAPTSSRSSSPLLAASTSNEKVAKSNQEKAERPEKLERAEPSEGQAKSEQPSPSGKGEKGEEPGGGAGRSSGRGN